MAEIGLSIAGTAMAALGLAERLYQVGSNMAAAGDEINCIARHLNNYSDVLNILAHRLKTEDLTVPQPTESIIEGLEDESQKLFMEIEDALPIAPDGLKQPNIAQRLEWHFKKPKVEFFVRQIEHLKSTLSLLLGVLFAGKNIRSYTERVTNLDPRNPFPEKKMYRTLSLQYLSARNALREYVYASRRLRMLEEQARESDQEVSHAQRANQSDSTSQPESSDSILPGQAGVGRTFSVTLDAAVAQPSGKQTSAVANPDSLLRHLFQEWGGIKLSSDDKRLLSQLETSQPPPTHRGSKPSSDQGNTPRAHGSRSTSRSSPSDQDHVARNDANDTRNDSRAVHGDSKTRSRSARLLNPSPTPQQNDLSQHQRHACFKEGRQVGLEQGKKVGHDDAEEAGYIRGKHDGFEVGERFGFGSGREAGYEAGKEQGFQQGFNIGYRKGASAGYIQGLKDGRLPEAAVHSTLTRLKFNDYASQAPSAPTYSRYTDHQRSMSTPPGDVIYLSQTSEVTQGEHILVANSTSACFSVSGPRLRQRPIR